MFYNIIVYVVYVALLPVYRLRVRGAENIPQGAAVVCGNHTARVDAVVVFLALFLHEMCIRDSIGREDPHPPPRRCGGMRF